MGYYFTFIGAIISLCAVWAWCSQIRLWFIAERANGSIVGFEERLRYVGQTRKIYYHPRIEFATDDGQLCCFTWGGGSTTASHEIGDTIVVVYDREKPEKARVASFMGMWAGPIAASILGGCTLAAGIHLILYPD